jgi:hypothetical protein
MQNTADFKLAIISIQKSFHQFLGDYRQGVQEQTFSMHLTTVEQPTIRPLQQKLRQSVYACSGSQLSGNVKEKNDLRFATFFSSKILNRLSIFLLASTRTTEAITAIKQNQRRVFIL